MSMKVQVGRRREQRWNRNREIKERAMKVRGTRMMREEEDEDEVVGCVIALMRTQRTEESWGVGVFFFFFF